MSNQLTIRVVDSPADAPNYNRDEIDVRAATLHTAIIVLRGTKGGNPTVDFQFRDQQGGEFVAMLTAEIIEQLANVIRAAREKR